jgi:hypothetical protein
MFEDPPAVGGAPAGAGDSEYQRGDVGFKSVCIAASYQLPGFQNGLESLERWMLEAGSWKQSYGRRNTEVRDA